MWDKKSIKINTLRDKMETMNKDIFEGGDYLLDMELMGWNKKRSRGEAFHNAEDGRQDEDYIRFLKHINGFWEAKFVEEDEGDPCYMEFLRHLKEHGTAYMCDVSKEHGIMFPIVYGAANDSPAKSKRKSPQSGLKVSHVWTCNSDGIERRITKSRKSDNVSIDRNLDVDGNQSTGPKISVSADSNYKTFIGKLHVVKGSVFSNYGDHEIYYEFGKKLVEIAKEPHDTDTASPSLTRRPAVPPVRPPIPPQVTRRPRTPHLSPLIPPTVTRSPPAPRLTPAVPSSTTKRKQNPTSNRWSYYA